MNNHSSRLKKLFPNKQKYIFNDLKESLTCNVHGSEPQIRDWKLFNDESDYLLPCSSMQTVAYSSSAESSGMTAIKDEPDRLITDVSEKSLEVSFIEQIHLFLKYLRPYFILPFRFYISKNDLECINSVRFRRGKRLVQKFIIHRAKN